MKHPVLFFIILLLFCVSPPAQANDPAALNAEGLSHFHAGHLEEALAAFEQAHMLAPDEAIIRENLGLTLNQLAVSLAQGDQKREALYYFDKLRDLGLARGTFMLNFGRLLSRIGEAERALWIYQEALEKDLTAEERQQTMFCMADAYAAQSLHEESAGLLNRLLSENQKFPGAAFLLGLSEYRQGHLELAREKLEQSLRNDPPEFASQAQSLMDKISKESSVESGFQTLSNSHFLIQFDGDRADDVVDEVTEVLGEAYREIGHRLGRYLEGQVPVIIYTGAQFRQASGSPLWAAALYDGKIRLPIGEIRYSRERLKQLVTHEFTHCVLHELSAGKCPAWLNEGLAQLLEGRTVNQSLTENVRKAITDGKLLRLDHLQNTFMNLPHPELVSLAYDQSFLLTMRIVENQGMFTLLDAFEQMRREDKSGGEILAEALFKDNDSLLADFARNFSY